MGEFNNSTNYVSRTTKSKKKLGIFKYGSNRKISFDDLYKLV